MDKQKENQGALVKDLHNEVISLKNLLNVNVSNNVGQGGLVTATMKPVIPAWQLEANQESIKNQNEEI